VLKKVVRAARARMDDFIFKDASAAAATNGQVCDWDSLFRSLSIYKWVRNRRLASRMAIVATAGASLKLKSSNPARAHLTLIGLKTDRSRNANGKPNRQCDSAFRLLELTAKKSNLNTGNDSFTQMSLLGFSCFCKSIGFRRSSRILVTFNPPPL